MNTMQNTRLGFCVILGLLGLIALATAIGAEFKHTKADEVRYKHGECILPSSPALWLGTTAAIALLIAQLVANAMGGCVCCCTKHARKIPSKNKSIAILCLFVSWVTFGFAFFLLVVGSSMNQKQPYKRQWIDNECYVVKPGIFASAGVLSLLTVMLDMVFYMALTTRRIEDVNVAIARPSNEFGNQNANGGADEQRSVEAVSYPVSDGTKDPVSKYEATV